MNGKKPTSGIGKYIVKFDSMTSKTMRSLLAIALTALLIACDSAKPEEAPPPSGPTVIKTSVAFTNLSFRRPVDLQQPLDNTNRLFVVEQAGIISVFARDPAVAAKKVFLDITDRVDDSGNEEGLLGLAFHPNYKTNGYFFVNYTASNPDRTVISKFKVSSDPDIADPASETQILSFTQPYSNHNGGQLSFGPDGFLYIAIGDGGSGGDPQNNAQNRSTLLGKIARIDINSTAAGLNYGIPADNPFKGNTSEYREEIYAYGMRNPWRLSFDAVTGQLWTGDVGQNAYEEIDIIEKGGNYGWKLMEGKHCYTTNCNETGLKLPVWEYPRSEGISITGGFVYRGSLLPSLKGKYIYADYGSQKIWALDAADAGNPVNKELVIASFPVASFGVDVDNELYICGFDGKIHKLEETE
jgi:glucose/arabinose dehydrogenase